MPDFNPSAVLTELGPEEEAAVVSMLETLGLEPEDWPAVPPLATLLPLVAVLRASEGVEGSTTDAIRAAAEALGVPDDDDRDSAHHPGDRYSRTLRRWHRRAEEARGQNDRPPSEDAA